MNVANVYLYSGNVFPFTTHNDRLPLPSRVSTGTSEPVTANADELARQRTRNLREKESLESVWRTFRVFSRAELFFYHRGFRGTQRLMFFGCALRSGQERSRPQGDCYRFVAVRLWRMFPHRVPRVGRFCCAGFWDNNNFHSP